MSLGQDKGRDRKRIFQSRSWGVFGRRLASRLEIRVESCFTIASARGFVSLRGGERGANFSIDVAGQPDESDPKEAAKGPEPRGSVEAGKAGEAPRRGTPGGLSQPSEIQDDSLLSNRRTTEPPNCRTL